MIRFDGKFKESFNKKQEIKEEDSSPRFSQAHNFYRTIVALIKVAAPVNHPSVAEVAFLHHTTRGGIVHKEVRPKGLEMFDVEAVVDHGTEGLRAEALVPVRFGNPVAKFGILFSDRDVAFTVRVIAHTADGLIGFF